MVSSNDEDLVAGWIRYAQEKRDADFWAFDKVNEIVRNDRQEAWRLILALVERAPDDLLGRVGAGPIEHFVRDHHTAVIEQVADEACANARFRDALSWMWFRQGEVPSHVERQLLAVTNNAIRVL